MAKAKAQPKTPPSSFSREGSSYTTCDVCKKSVPKSAASFHVADCKGATYESLNITEAEVQERKRSSEELKENVSSNAKSRKSASSDDAPTKGRGKGAKKQPKKPKDPNAPKRPQTAYFLFMNAIRAVIKAENPEAKITEISKLMGERWKSLDPEEKKKYEQQAAEDKERYHRELNEKKAESTPEQNENEHEEETVNDEDDEKKEHAEQASAEEPGDGSSSGNIQVEADEEE